MRRPLILVVVAMLASACTSEDNPPEAATSVLYTQPPDFSDSREPSTDQPPDTYDPSCHWDCFGGIGCSDGTVTRYEHAPIPCDRWTGSCPSHVVLQCQEGCRDDGFHIESFYPDSSQGRLFCKENIPTEGSFCNDDIECFIPTDYSTNPPTVHYLKCDLINQKCIIFEPQTPSDYLQTCQRNDFQAPIQKSFTESTLCEGGVCIVHYIDDESIRFCERHLQGCTTFCSADLDCPQGSRCLPTGQIGGDFRSACKPGQPDQWEDIGLQNTCE